jgi:rRNA-processing protein EBP2
VYIEYLFSRPNKKRLLKNKKFGFGGQKKRGKYNTASSAASMSDFSIKKHQGRPGQKNQKGNRVGLLVI